MSMLASLASVQAMQWGHNRAEEKRRETCPVHVLPKVGPAVQELAEQSKELLQQQLQTQLAANQAKRAQVRVEVYSRCWLDIYCHHIAFVHLSCVLGGLALLPLAASKHA